MRINEQMLQALAEVQHGRPADRKMMDTLVVHALLVHGAGAYTISWVGKIALEAYAVGRGIGIVAA